MQSPSEIAEALADYAKLKRHHAIVEAEVMQLREEVRILRLTLLPAEPEGTVAE
jgi:hypothetical protein